ADPLGKGGSSRPPNGYDLTIDVLAMANHIAVGKLQHDFATGAMTGSPHAVDRIIGVGHSMGAMITAFQQATYATFSEIWLLGFCNLGWPLHGHPDARVLEEAIDGYYPASHARLKDTFFFDDVPDAVVKADEELAVPGPAPVIELTRHPGAVTRQAQQVTA